jgi:hypothetical protein
VVNLLAQRIKRDAQCVTDEIVDVLAIKVEVAVMPRKQHFSQTIQNVFQRFARGCASRLSVASDAVGFFTGSPQVGDDTIERPTLSGRAVLVGRDDLGIRQEFAPHVASTPCLAISNGRARAEY